LVGSATGHCRSTLSSSWFDPLGACCSCFETSLPSLRAGPGFGDIGLVEANIFTGIGGCFSEVAEVHGVVVELGACMSRCFVTIPKVFVEDGS
jgi:hypothetical protein